jgi:hypothetical protein
MQPKRLSQQPSRAGSHDRIANFSGGDDSQAGLVIFAQPPQVGNHAPNYDPFPFRPHALEIASFLYPSSPAEPQTSWDSGRHAQTI